MKTLKFGFTIIILLFLLWLCVDHFRGYKVLKVIDGDTVYVDLNRNNKAEKEEKIRIKSIDTFETKYSYQLSKQSKVFGITQKQALGLGYLGKEFAKKKLLNKRVKVQIDGKGDFNRKLAHIYINGQNYEKLILKEGLASVYKRADDAEKYLQYENTNKIKQNAQKAKDLDLVILNLKNNKYHKPYCKYARNISRFELVEKKHLLQADAKQAGCCKKKNFINHKEQRKYLQSNNITNPVFEKAVPDIQTKNIELYFIDPTKYKKPVNYCRTAAVQALIREIDKAKNTIDFSVFGFSNQPELIKSIKKASLRGVKVRWVTDVTPWNFNFYSGTKEAMKKIPNYKTDFNTDKKLLEKFRKKGMKSYNGTLIHNKFFIIDNKLVWTGSTNISSSGTGGYNANVSALIRSKKIANIYTKEFNQMFIEEKFHRDKQKIFTKNLILKDGSIISIYFSPNPSIIDEGITPVISSSNSFIYMPMFYLTNEKIFEALIGAKKRNVDVKIIVDAHYAKSQHSKVKKLRDAGIKLKVENWGGKMHMKSMITDNDYIVIGSTNFTKTGITQNDENMLIIKNSKLNQKFKSEFLKYWKSIPDKWLYNSPLPEGKDSINSCSDGIDNDHDGYYDKKDFDCS